MRFFTSGAQVEIVFMPHKQFLNVSNASPRVCESLLGHLVRRDPRFTAEASGKSKSISQSFVSLICCSTTWMVQNIGSVDESHSWDFREYDF